LADEIVALPHRQQLAPIAGIVKSAKAAAYFSGAAAFRF
jgi:hypothetical protein